MTEVSKINRSRLVLGGITAGVVLNFITGFANATLFNGAFQTWASEMGSHLHPPSPAAQIVLWVVMCLIDGMSGVWIYAGLRPRFGAGPKTALLAGLSVWVVGRFCVTLDMMALGVFPLQMMVGQAALGLFAILSSVLIGAWLYKE
jgi:hypothetical protein